MDDRPSPPPSEPTEPHEDEPQMAALVSELRRALEQASPEDRAVVLGHLEALAHRFRGRGLT